jgi:methylated-DNA-protein-cysteine methyltransferase-like protein
MNFYDKVFYALKLVPKGEVTTYGDIAKFIGLPKNSRQVGWALHKNPQPIVNPCHRVVFADGSLAKGFAFGGIDVQKDLLQSEGVKVENYKVDLTKYRHNFIGEIGE